MPLGPDIGQTPFRRPSPVSFLGGRIPGRSGGRHPPRNAMAILPRVARTVTRKDPDEKGFMSSVGQWSFKY